MHMWDCISMVYFTASLCTNNKKPGLIISLISCLAPFLLLLLMFSDLEEGEIPLASIKPAYVLFTNA